MKRMIIFSLICSFIFASYGCSYISYKSYYTDIDDYTQIWDFPGIHNDECDSFLFPKNIEKLQVNNFFCRYDEQLPLGEGVQILLSVKYDESLFSTEIERILNVTFNGNNYFEQSQFSFFISYLGKNYSSEYVLVNEEKHEIHYIYLQCIPKEEIELDHKLLPINYAGYGEIL